MSLCVDLCVGLLCPLASLWRSRGNLMTFMTLYSFVQAWASVGNPRSMGNPRGQHIWVDEIKRSRGVGVGCNA